MTPTGETLRLLCNTLSDAVIGLDSEYRITLFNVAAEQVFRLESGSVVGHCLDEYTTTEHLEPLLERLASNGNLLDDGLWVLFNTTYQVHVFPTPDFPHLIVLKKRAPCDEGQLSSMMSEIVHTLKAPITSTKSFIELVEEVGSLSEKQAMFIRRAQISLDQMLTVVHQLLDVAWLESGGDLARTTIDFIELVKRSTSQFDSYAQRQNVELVLDLPVGNCSIQGDARRLEGAISNLVSNAIKYSPEGGRVLVSVHYDQAVCNLQVEDQGIGIAPEHLPHVFERFYRVQSPQTHRIEGSGLGLSIVKAIVEKHGGRVFAESVPGQGSIFGFSLPAI